MNTHSTTSLSRRLNNPALVLLLLALWLLATLGVRPLLLPDEGRYGNVAREMLLGDGLVPTLNGLPFFHKPPLMYWLDMTAFQVFGVSAFAARFGAFVGAWFMGASLFLALRRWVGLRLALIALGILATCPFFYVGSQYANLDMLVAGMLTVAVLCFVRALELPKIDLAWLVAGWLACALAMLAKGLIGFVLPALVLGPWLLAQGRWRQIIGMLHPLGLLAFGLVAAPWFLWMQQRFPGFYDYFFIEQHFRRFAQATFNNVHPFWFYIAVLPLLTLPWSLYLRSQLQPSPDAQAQPLKGLTSLMVWWVLAIVGFFSLPSSKLVGYILPALAPWCALLAVTVARGRAWRWLIPTSAALCVAVVLGLACKAPGSHRDVAEELARVQQADDHVVFINEAFYDVPFYAHLRQPAIVLSTWSDADISQHDNWRKEFADAARFDTAQAAKVLWTPDRLATLRCSPGTTWLVAEKNYSLPAELGTASPVFTGANAQLLRLEKTGCP
ncbi:MAG: glycosyltransferase family 39 protein [Burkholderiales bacterium]|nr:glycosyltransferase family 39 protein [Burkholderiales bacterium]